jgi:hypothetical protein
MNRPACETLNSLYLVNFATFLNDGFLQAAFIFIIFKRENVVVLFLVVLSQSSEFCRLLIVIGLVGNDVIQPCALILSELGSKV